MNKSEPNVLSAKEQNMRQISLSILICISVICSAQNPYTPIPMQSWDKMVTLDTAFIRVSYTMTFRDALFYKSSRPGGLNDHEFTENEILSDTRIVEIGKKVRKDYSYILETREMQNLEMLQRGEQPRNLQGKYVYPLEIFIFDGKSRVNRRTLMTGPILQYEEDNTPMQWNLTGETSQVGNYQCQKAVTSFGGREWEVWFCTDIPVDGGPYKFSGLPGLILKVSDTEGHFSWNMVGIEKGTWPIYEKQYLFRRCSPAEAGKTIRNMYIHPFKFLESAGIKAILSDGRGGVREPGESEFSLSIYYDPIELTE